MTLEQYAEPKIEELSQQITALIIQLEPLPANTQDISKGEKINLSSADDKKAEDTSGNSLWSTIKDQAQASFDEAIVIRKHDKPIEIELDADSRLRLYNLIQLRLETLRLMVLRGLDSEFHEQIKLINKTLQQYYPEEKAKPLLKIMKEMDSNNLSPERPDISASIKQLESALLTEAKDEASPQEGKN